MWIGWCRDLLIKLFFYKSALFYKIKLGALTLLTKMNVSNKDLADIVEAKGKEIRCINCNKMQFKGIIKDAIVSIKCDRCGSINFVGCIQTKEKEVLKAFISKEMVK